MSTLFPQGPGASSPSGSAEDATAVLPPTGPSTAIVPAYRVPRVDLLPPEILVRRRFVRTQRRSAVALVAVLAVITAGYAVQVRAAGEAADELAVAQARTASLQAEQVQFARAPQVYAQVEAAQAALRTAMSDDVRWYSYLADLTVTAPDGVWLTSITASVEPAAVVADPLAATGAAAPVGTLSIAGTVTEETQVADWLEVVDATPGLSGAATSGITRTAVGPRPVFAFESSASITADALSGRYEQETN